VILSHLSWNQYHDWQAVFYWRQILVLQASVLVGSTALAMNLMKLLVSEIP
jgi:hypothetical protein